MGFSIYAAHLGFLFWNCWLITLGYLLTLWMLNICCCNVILNDGFVAAALQIYMDLLFHFVALFLLINRGYFYAQESQLMLLTLVFYFGIAAQESKGVAALDFWLLEYSMMFLVILGCISLDLLLKNLG